MAVPVPDARASPSHSLSEQTQPERFPERQREAVPSLPSLHLVPVPPLFVSLVSYTGHAGTSGLLCSTPGDGLRSGSRT